MDFFVGGDGQIRNFQPNENLQMLILLKKIAMFAYLTEL